MPAANIIIWRHAEAEFLASSGLDADRALTEKGLADARKIGVWLEKNLPKDIEIYCSPALRCKQTLEALLALNPKKKVYQVDFTEILSIDSSAENILQHLSRVTSQAVLLVGHQPLLGELVSSLLMGEASEFFAIKKGAAWWLRHQQHQEIAMLTEPLNLLGNMEVLTVQSPKFLK